MPNLFDYIKWRGDLSFTEVPPNDVDALILSEVTYLPLAEFVPSLERRRQVRLAEAAERFFAIYGEQVALGLIIPSKKIVPMFLALGKTKRFGEVLLSGFENRIDLHEEEQFCALSATLDNGETFVLYRGTDDTLVGWKENLNMGFRSPVPAQADATAYLNRVSRRIKEGNLVVAGHSKGGNLAVYAAAHCMTDARDRIRLVYNCDGPGFTADLMAESGYRAIEGRLRSILPEFSVVGMIFEQGGEKCIVESDGKGLNQHDGFTWQVVGGSFVAVDDVSESSKEWDRTLKAWVASMTYEEKTEFVEAIYSLFTMTNAKTLSEVMANLWKLVFTYSSVDERSRKIVWNGLRRLIAEKTKRTRSTPELSAEAEAFRALPKI